MIPYAQSGWGAGVGGLLGGIAQGAMSAYQLKTQADEAQSLSEYRKGMLENKQAETALAANTQQIDLAGKQATWLNDAAKIESPSARVAHLKMLGPGRFGMGAEDERWTDLLKRAEGPDFPEFSRTFGVMLTKNGIDTGSAYDIYRNDPKRFETLFTEAGDSIRAHEQQVTTQRGQDLAAQRPVTAKVDQNVIVPPIPGSGGQATVLQTGQPGAGQKAPAGYRYKTDNSGELEAIPGGPGDPDVKLSPEEGAKIGAVKDALGKVADYRKSITGEDGKFDKTKYGVTVNIPHVGKVTAPIPGTGSPMALFEQASGGLRHTRLGATMTPEELDTWANSFKPSVLDSPETVETKLKGLEDALKSDYEGRTAARHPQGTPEPKLKAPSAEDLAEAKRRIKAGEPVEKLRKFFTDHGYSADGL